MDFKNFEKQSFLLEAQPGDQGQPTQTPGKLPWPSFTPRINQNIFLPARAAPKELFAPATHILFFPGENLLGTMKPFILDWPPRLWLCQRVGTGRADPSPVLT